LGLNADVLLGARIPAGVIDDPSLDSQNRFYGAAFTLYGVLLVICANDLGKYAVILKAALWVLMAGGIGRLISIGIHGMPSAPILMLLVTELVVPPLIVLWLRKLRRSGPL